MNESFVGYCFESYIYIMNGPYMCHEKKLESKHIRFDKSSINQTFSFILLDIFSFILLYIFALQFQSHEFQYILCQTSIKNTKNAPTCCLSCWLEQCVWLVKIKSVFAKGKVLGKAKCAKRVVFCYVSNQTKGFKVKE